MWNVKTEVILHSNNRFDWNHLRIIHKIPESHTQREHEIEKLQKQSHTGALHTYC